MACLWVSTMTVCHGEVSVAPAGAGTMPDPVSALGWWSVVCSVEGVGHVTLAVSGVVATRQGDGIASNTSNSSPKSGMLCGLV